MPSFAEQLYALARLIGAKSWGEGEAFNLLHACEILGGSMYQPRNNLSAFWESTLVHAHFWADKLPQVLRVLRVSYGEEPGIVKAIDDLLRIVHESEA